MSVGSLKYWKKWIITIDTFLKAKAPFASSSELCEAERLVRRASHEVQTVWNTTNKVNWKSSDKLSGKYLWTRIMSYQPTISYALFFAAFALDTIRMTSLRGTPCSRRYWPNRDGCRRRTSGCWWPYAYITAYIHNNAYATKCQLTTIIEHIQRNESNFNGELIISKGTRCSRTAPTKLNVLHRRGRVVHELKSWMLN